MTLLGREGGTSAVQAVIHGRIVRRADRRGARGVRFRRSAGTRVEQPVAGQRQSRSRWEKPGYLDSAWQAAEDLGDYGMAPWGVAGSKSSTACPRGCCGRSSPSKKGPAGRRFISPAWGSRSSTSTARRWATTCFRPALNRLRQARALRHLRRDEPDGAGPQRHRARCSATAVSRAARPTAARAPSAIPKALLQLEHRIRRRQPRDPWSATRRWKLTTDGPIRANNEYDGEEYDARKEMPGWAAPGFDDSNWQAAEVVAAPAGALACADGRAPPRDRDAEAGRCRSSSRPASSFSTWARTWWAGAGCKWPARRGRRCAAPRRDAERPTARSTSPTCARRRRTDIYTLKGGRPESLGAALHLSRLPLRRGDRLSRRARRRPRSKAAWSTTTWHARAISPARTSCSTRFTTTCSGAFAATTAASPPIARSATSARAGSATARQVSRSESYLFDVAAFYTKWTADMTDSQRAERQHPGCCAELLAALQRRRHLAEHASSSCPECSTTSMATRACSSGTIRQ